MTSVRRRFVVAAFCLSAAAAPASWSRAAEQTAPSFRVRPVLVKSSDGAFVHYQLDRQTTRSDVLINGRRARVFRTGGPREAVFDVFVSDGRLRSGRLYPVSITVVSRTGGTASRRELLYLHKRFPRG